MTYFSSPSNLCTAATAAIMLSKCLVTHWQTHPPSFFDHIFLSSPPSTSQFTKHQIDALPLFMGECWILPGSGSYFYLICRYLFSLLLLTPFYLLLYFLTTSTGFSPLFIHGYGSYFIHLQLLRLPIYSSFSTYRLLSVVITYTRLRYLTYNTAAHDKRRLSTYTHTSTGDHISKSTTPVVLEDFHISPDECGFHPPRHNNLTDAQLFMMEDYANIKGRNAKRSYDEFQKREAKRRKREAKRRAPFGKFGNKKPFNPHGPYYDEPGAYDEEPYYDQSLFKPHPRISGPGPRQSTNAQASGSRQHTITQPDPVSEKSASSQTRNPPASSTVDRPITSSTTTTSAPAKLPTKKVRRRDHSSTKAAT